MTILEDVIQGIFSYLFDVLDFLSFDALKWLCVNKGHGNWKLRRIAFISNRRAFCFVVSAILHIV
jgi:hypothetical protein